MPATPLPPNDNPLNKYPLWIHIILVLCFVVNFSVLFMPDDKLDDKTLESVSGYYGIGSCLAWIVTVLSNVEFVAYAKIMRRMLKREQLFKAEDLLEFRVDLNMIASITYPIIAIVDLMKSIDITQDTSDSVQPQRAVAHLASFASLLALFTYVPYGMLITQLDHTTHIQGKPFSRRSFFARVGLWAIVCLFSSVGEILTGNLSVHYQYLAFFSTIVLCMPAPLSFHKLMCQFAAMPPFLGLISASSSFIFLGNIIHESTDLGQKKRGWRFTFPQSPTSIADLGQAATLGVALFALMVTFAVPVKAWLKDRSHSVQAQNTAWYI